MSSGDPQIELLGGALGDTLIANSSRFQYLARHLHSLGPRAVYELLREVVAGADPVDRLERYARLDPAWMHVLGADALPVDCLAVFDGGRR